MTDIKQSVLLKSDMRKHVSNDHFESFTSSVINSEVRTFIDVIDVTLKSGGSLHKPQGLSSTIVLPLVGGVQANLDGSSIQLLSEQLLIVGSESSVQLQNFNEEAVNFILFSLKTENPGAEAKVYPIGVSAYDELVTIQSNEFSSESKISVGVYKSRSKAIYTCADESSEILLFVVNGSFEVEGRLIEYRDSLVLWNKHEMEFEALADDSILCIVEI